MIAAYALVLSFITSNCVQQVKNTSNGKKLINSLNSGFAICLLFSILSIFMTIVILCIKTLGLESVHADYFNIIGIFLVSYLLFLSISVILGVIIDLYNSGQTSLL